VTKFSLIKFYQLDVCWEILELTYQNDIKKWLTLFVLLYDLDIIFLWMTIIKLFSKHFQTRIELNSNSEGVFVLNLPNLFLEITFLRI